VKEDEAPEPPKEETKQEPEDAPKEEEAPEPETPAKVELETPETTEPESPKLLTKEDVQAVVGDLLNTERSSSRELDSTTKEVLDAYYPQGLSNVVVDEKTGIELKTPQDVVDLYEKEGQEISHEKAAQWLMNEQYRIDQAISKIKDDAKGIAETTINFRRDAQAAMDKYQPLFDKYPQLQAKVYDRFMKQVKYDKEKDIILSAPDVMDFYDFALEPYQMAIEYQNSSPKPEEKPEPPKPTTEDRMDIGGDGGQSEPDDPNDFAQQVKKELSKGL